MATYIYDHELQMMVDKETGLPMLNQEERARPPQLPRVFGDIEGYQSPIDGKWVEGRRARRYDLESNHCIPMDDIPRKKLKNEKFARKRGLEKHLEQ